MLQIGLGFSAISFPEGCEIMLQLSSPPYVVFEGNVSQSFILESMEKSDSVILPSDFPS